MRTEVWPRVRAERIALAGQLDGLAPEQWNEPSWCRGWRVRDVAGHLVYLAECTYSRGVAHVWRYGHGVSVNRTVDVTARRLGQREPSELPGRLRAAADGRYRAPGAPPVAALAEVVVHGEDIRRPLGLPAAQLEPGELVTLLAFYRRISRWFLRGSIRGLRLEATDAKWSEGTGAEVRGPALALLLAMAGRAGACEELAGDGVGQLRSRSRGARGA
ncbi:MAG TPA: maleylpyruvate isomerase family mycothiol-dependent enzyme [Acidimicrobiales bacterium]